MRGLPKIVLERLKRRAVADDHNRQFLHPDANLLAAFLEKTLTKRERTQLLNHLAQCAECRELVALSLPSKGDEAQAKHLPFRRQWSAWPTLRWGTLAAVLGTVAIVVALRPYLWRTHGIAARPASTETKQPVTLVATGREPVAVEGQKIPTVSSARQVSKGGRATSPGPVSTAPFHAEPAIKPPAAREEAMKAVPGAETQVDVTASATKSESVKVSKELNVGVVGGVLAPSSTPPSPPAAVLLRAKPQQAKLPSKPFREELAAAVAQPAALWTISAGGKVQRSEDGGKTWEEVRIDDTVTFRAVQAAGKEVWAGGSGGALYHSSDDGVTWTRANLSSGGSPTKETIVAIVSSSRNLQHITVRTASGERWATEDGGQHWKPVVSDE